MTNIFNLSFSMGVFPSELKFAKVIPTHKKGSKLKCRSYRPISLLSTLDKILEKMVYNKIYDFLEKYKLIYLLQFGFLHRVFQFNVFFNSIQDAGKGVFYL